MAPLDTQPLGKTFRGTVDEVFSHRDEIPPGATVELKIIATQPEADAETGAFGDKSIADLINEIGTVKGLPSDMAAHPEKYLQEFGTTNDRRTLE